MTNKSIVIAGLQDIKNLLRSLDSGTEMDAVYQHYIQTLELAIGLIAGGTD